MPISIQTEEKKQLTIFTVKGEMNVEQAAEALKKFYEGTPTLHAIWDFSYIIGMRPSSQQIRGLIALTSKIGTKRPGGKTALITSSKLDFGLTRMSEVFGELENTPWEIRAFSSIEEATKWIEGEED